MVYILNRILQMVLILVALSVLLFGLLSAMPGNPVDMLITSNPRIKPEDVVRLKKLRGLDQPWYVQYVRWMWGYKEPIRPPEIAALPAGNMLGKQVELDVKPFVTIYAHQQLQIDGLLGSHAKGGVVTQTVDSQTPCVWFRVTDGAGLQQVGCIPNPRYQKGTLAIKLIPPQVVDDPQVFHVDVRSYVESEAGMPLHFELVDSPGTIDAQGIYRHVFTGTGQSIVQLVVKDEKGNAVKSAFAVEQGPIGDPARFTPGFLFFFTGNTDALGFSNAYKRPVWELLVGSENTTDTGTMTAWLTSSGRIGNTLQLMIPAIILSLLIALPLGVLSAYRQYSWLDYTMNFFAFIGISLPVFWFAIMVMYVFAEYLQWLPAGGMQTPGLNENDTLAILKDRLSYAILPTVVLSIAYVGRWMRYMRASMLEILPADYIRTARAKGLRERVVILKHALRNALIPVVTILALSIPALFGGAVLTETVFSWPGIGRLEYDAVVNSDYYVAIVVFLISSALVMFGNLLADVLYVLVDPRIRKAS